jgi:glutathione synthase/RimK-type ligase-like ATP-grasp enzyme
MLQTYVGKPARPALSFRVLCSPRTTIACYQRLSEANELVQSVSTGARRLNVEDTELYNALSRLGQRMCQSVGCHVAGVDILQDLEGRLWPLEVNTAPGFDAPSGIADKYVQEVLFYC